MSAGKTQEFLRREAAMKRTNEAIGSGLRSESCAYNDMAFFQPQNMSMETRMCMHEKRSKYQLPRYKTPAGMFNALNRLVCDHPSIGDHEARQLQDQNDRRLASMEYAIEFGGYSESAVERMMGQI